MPRSPLRSLLLAGVLLACAAPIASADSIVYIDGGNVWSASPDGARKVQLTDGGQWHSPTQSDDGTIAAVQGTGPITVMAGDGRVLRTIQTPMAKSGDGGTFAPRPVDLSFSPDGSKIAYSYVSYSCPVASSCGTIQRSTFYTRADATPDATPISVWGNQFSVSDPEWVSNDRVINFGGAGSQVNFDDVTDGQDYSHTNWFNLSRDQGDGELSRDGRKLAALFDYGKDTLIVFWAVKAGEDPRTQIPSMPSEACELSEPDEKFGDPSWSPDSLAVAFESSAGVETLRFTEYAANHCVSTGPSVVLSATGSEPDWGPANPPAARYVAPAPPAPAPPAPAPGGPQGPATTAGAPLTVVAAGALTQRFRSSLSIGCTVSAAGTCKAVAKVKAGGRTYTSKGATANATAGRRVTLKVTFGAKAAKAIRAALRKGKVKAAVTVSSGTAVTTRTVTLKR